MQRLHLSEDRRKVQASWGLRQGSPEKEVSADWSQGTGAWERPAQPLDNLHLSLLQGPQSPLPSTWGHHSGGGPRRVATCPPPQGPAGTLQANARAFHPRPCGHQGGPWGQRRGKQHLFRKGPSPQPQPLSPLPALASRTGRLLPRGPAPHPSPLCAATGDCRETQGLFPSSELGGEYLGGPWICTVATFLLLSPIQTSAGFQRPQKCFNQRR